MRAIATCVFALLACAPAAAQEVPLQSPGDPRVRYVTYSADRSVVIKVRRGVVTRLILERDEAIRLSGTGFLSRCEVESDEWCIRTEKGENQVWIKPRTGATHNNLELATDKRDYSIRLEVLPDAPKGQAPADEVYRAIFVYPNTAAAGGSTVASIPPPPAGASQDQVLSARGNLNTLGCSAARKVVNTKYSREKGPDSLTPVRVFDDGARTVFVFGDSAAIPTVFAIGDSETESRVNFSVDGNCLVVHQLGKEFVLRAGQASLRVFNEAFSATADSPALRALRQSREVLP